MSDFKPRNVALVSLYIVSQLPDDQTEFTPLRILNAHGNVAIPLINRPIMGDLNVQWCKKDIMRVVKDLRYTPPEDMFISRKWILLENIMKKQIPTISDTDCSWKKKIVDIFIGNVAIPE